MERWWLDAGAGQDDLAELERCASALRGGGWADFVTFQRLFADWRRLAGEVGDYPATVDDYTNDLSSRTGLHLIQQCCSRVVDERLAEHLSPVDAQFTEGTDADDSGVLGRFCRVDEDSGWWLRRIPKTGPLRTYLDDAGP